MGFVPLNGTYEIGEKLLARFEKTKETTEARWVWREFCIPLNVRVNGGNGVLFTGVTDNTGWFVLPYVLVSSQRSRREGIRDASVVSFLIP